MSKDLNKLTKADQLNIPNYIIIEGYEYKFKQALAKDNISYRCKNRSCGTHLTISKEELKKFNDNKDIKNINFSINKEHICNKKIINKTAKIEDISTETEIYKKAKFLIELNLEKPLNWHIKNLIDNNISLKRKKIENILYNERADKYPADNEYLYFLENITITLNETNDELKNLPFCYGDYKIINNQKNNRSERFLLFTSKYQLKEFSMADEIYIKLIS